MPLFQPTLKPIPYFRRPGSFVDELWYSSNILSPSSSTTLATANDLIYMVPFVVSQKIKAVGIGARITVLGDAGSSVRLGIYKSREPDIFQSDLIVDAGLIVGTSSAAQSIVIDNELSPGLYHLSLIHDSLIGITFRALNGSELPNVYGMGPAFVTSNYGYIQFPEVFGPLPATVDMTGNQTFSSVAAPKIFLLLGQ